jgi:outer membrane biosynthesis protein TonB
MDPPWPELDASVVAAIRQWKYEPTCLDGHPVKVELKVSVHIDFG